MKYMANDDKPTRQDEPYAIILGWVIQSYMGIFWRAQNAGKTMHKALILLGNFTKTGYNNLLRTIGVRLQEASAQLRRLSETQDLSNLVHLLAWH